MLLAGFCKEFQMNSWTKWLLPLIIVQPGCGRGLTPKGEVAEQSQQKQNPDAQTKSEDPKYAVTLTDESKLPACNESSNGRLIYLLSTKQFKTCDGNVWVSIDISGTAGTNGKDGENGTNGKDGVNGSAIMSVYANGVKIGKTFQFWGTNPNKAFVQMSVINNQGFSFNLVPETGEIRAFYGESNLNFESTDCTGPAYSANIYSPGQVIGTNTGGVKKLFYVPLDATFSTSKTFRSRFNGVTSGVCLTLTSPTIHESSAGYIFYPAYPNDPAVTGLTPETTFQTPITIE